MHNKQEQLAAIGKALDDLFEARFTSINDYSDLVATGQLAQKGTWADDRAFQKQNPDHPLNSENRGKRMFAADAARDRTMELQESLPAEILDKMHTALFDCSAAVRLSIAHALFYCGSGQSAGCLEKLLDEERESKMVREYAGIALVRCRMRGLKQLPEGKHVIMLVSKDIQLAIALHQLVEEEGAYLYMAQYDYTEMIVWSSAAAVQVVDRWLMGQDKWNAFCDYLDDVNEAETEYPIRDENGEVLMEEPIFDHTPLIITDWHMEKSLKEFREPDKLKDKLFYIEGGTDYVVAKLVEYFLLGKEIDLGKINAELNDYR